MKKIIALLCLMVMIITMIVPSFSNYGEYEFYFGSAVTDTEVIRGEELLLDFQISAEYYVSFYKNYEWHEGPYKKQRKVSFPLFFY